MSDDPERQWQTFISPEPGTRAWVGRELDQHVFALWASRTVLMQTSNDDPTRRYYEAEARVAEVQIVSIAETAHAAGLLTEEEVVDLMGEDETRARAVVSSLRGGVVYHSMRREPDGTLKTWRTGPDGEESASFGRPKPAN